jgi:Flp pilus assembly protein TadD
VLSAAAGHKPLFLINRSRHESGDLAKARIKILKAYQLDPTNPTVINNLQLLNASYRFVQRAP